MSGTVLVLRIKILLWLGFIIVVGASRSNLRKYFAVQPDLRTQEEAGGEHWSVHDWKCFEPAILKPFGKVFIFFHILQNSGN